MWRSRADDEDARSSSSPARPYDPLPVDAAHAEVFDFEEFLDAVFRTFAADAALLHAAERRGLDRDDAFVDADDAVFERLGDAPDVAEWASVGLEAVERRDGLKSFPPS